MNAQQMIEAIGTTLQRWIEASRGRRELRNLDERMLKDIGTSQVDAEREARRPFWDLEVQRDGTLRDGVQMERKRCRAACCQPN